MLAALVIIAAAGPLWNPPVATAAAKAPLALLIDDGFPAAGTWDIRMRTTEDLIARAEADNRGVALVPLSEPSRDISFEDPGGSARAAQADQAEAARRRARGRTAGARPFPRRTRTSSWSGSRDGVDLGGGSDFVAALARLIGKRPDHRGRGRHSRRARARAAPRTRPAR